MMKRWPNFYLVGAMKAGTTSVANALAVHPDIFICPVKEPNYFSSDLSVTETTAGDHTRLKMAVGGDSAPMIHAGEFRDEGAYLSLFRDWKDEKIAGDCSTSYLYSEVAAEKIAEVAPDARILIVLRNPVERAFSEFIMNCSIGVAVPPFSRYLDAEEEERSRGVIPKYHKYVTAGLYFQQIEKYLEHFPSSQVKILLHDDMRKDFQGFMTQVLQFLDVDDRFIGEEVRSNSAKYPRWAVVNMLLKKSGIKNIAREMVPRHTKEYFKKFYYGTVPSGISLTEEDRERLVAQFTPDTEKLSQLMNRDLRVWLQ